RGWSDCASRNPPRPRRRAGSRSYMDELRQIHFESNPDVLEFDLTAAPQTISDQVGFTGDVVHIVRIRRERRTGEPLLVTEAWLPASLAQMITPEKLVHAPLYGLLAEAGGTPETVALELLVEAA